MDKKTFGSLYVSLGINVVLLLVILIFIFQSDIIGKKVGQGSVRKIYDVMVSSTAREIEKHGFTNKALQFSIEYPDTLTQPSISIVAVEEDRPDIGHVVLYDKHSKEKWDACGDACIEGGPDHIEISVYQNQKKLSPKEWIIENKDARYIYTNYDSLSQNLEYLSVGGKSATKYSWSGLGGADVVVIPDKENALIYSISARYMSENATIRGDLWYIISSFSFLN